jgi:hypothetical protein
VRDARLYPAITVNHSAVESRCGARPLAVTLGERKPNPASAGSGQMHISGQ